MGNFEQHASQSRSQVIRFQVQQDKFCEIDQSDADLMQFKWYYSKRGYVARNIGGRRNHKIETIHRIILSRIIGRSLLTTELCDHMDRNPLNNQRSNLRLGTKSQNGMNRGSQNGSESQYKGVCRIRNKWRAEITKDGVRYRLGHYNTQEEAATAYNEAAKIIHGDFAYYNDVSPMISTKRLRQDYAKLHAFNKGKKRSAETCEKIRIAALKRSKRVTS